MKYSSLVLFFLVFTIKPLPSLFVDTQKYQMSWVDRLSIRTAPSLNSKVIGYLLEGEIVRISGVAGTNKVSATLGGKVYTAPFYYIQTKEGVQGWVFAGGLKDLIWTRDDQENIFLHDSPEGRRLQRLDTSQIFFYLGWERVVKGVDDYGYTNFDPWTWVSNQSVNGWVPFIMLDSENPYRDPQFQAWAESFIYSFQKQKSLEKYFTTSHIKLIYHDDNRVDGSTDGEYTYNSAADIKRTIQIKVYTDGEGWYDEKVKYSSARGYHQKKFSFINNCAVFLPDPEYPDNTRYEILCFEKKIVFYMGAEYTLELYCKKNGNLFTIYEIRYSDNDPG